MSTDVEGTVLSRFSNRAENYANYRPGYPEEIFLWLEAKCGLNKSSRIADIGSGTGLFAEPLLQRGYTVVCIEPNEEMRLAGEDRLKQYAGFTSRKHRAEETGLRNHSIDLITIAQAFHWLDIEKSRKEFSRILSSNGHIALAWNIQQSGTTFMDGYLELKEQYKIEDKIPERINLSNIEQFFGEQGYEKKDFVNIQLLNFDALKGQLLSSSYIPLPGHPQYETMISALVQLFVKYNENGFIRMEFETSCFLGQ